MNEFVHEFLNVDVMAKVTPFLLRGLLQTLLLCALLIPIGLCSGLLTMLLTTSSRRFVRWPALALQVLKAASAMGKPAILDGDVAPDGIIEQLAPEATHIVFSEPAAQRLTGTSDVSEMTQLLKQRFAHAFICVTAGAAGSCWFDGHNNTVAHCPTISVKAIDTLAAGDIFHGAFALAIAEGMAPAAAIRFSSVAAAIKCESFGGRSGAPTRVEVICRSHSR